MAGEQRKLAAILAADVVGYSRLMGRDESGTLARLKAHRTERLEPTLVRYGGRIVKLTGDGALAEFPSAVNALSAAIEFQQAMSEANRGQPAERAIVFRIGLHLGDLIVDGDDLYGDGINVAARLEAEAPGGGIVLSGNLHDAVVGRIKVAFDDLGDLSLKNIERPLRAYRVRMEGSAATSTASVTSSSSHAPLTLPDKPSIAVLPFQNMSGDPEQEYFTDGITEDIITELSRFRSLFVIARNSAFSYKGRSPDVRQVGRELGVRYVLEGSIRRSSNRIRVTGQLIDTFTGNHIWAERYDRVLEDIFAVQEEVTTAIVAAIAPQIDTTELSRAARRRPENLTAYEIALRAWAHAWEANDKSDRELLDRAVLEAKEALAIDPNSVLALHALACAHGFALFLNLSENPGASLQEGRSASERAIELDSGNPLGYALRGVSVYLSLQFERYLDAAADARRAHEMNPNDTFILLMLSHLEIAVNEPQRAIEHGASILRLSPLQFRNHGTHQMLALASLMTKQYAAGIRWATMALNDRPRYPSALNNLICCLIGAGEITKAKAAFALAQPLAPEYFKLRLAGILPFHREEDRKLVQTFLRIAAGLDAPSAAEPFR